MAGLRRRFLGWLGGALAFATAATSTAATASDLTLAVDSQSVTLAFWHKSDPLENGAVFAIGNYTVDGLALYKNGAFQGQLTLYVKNTVGVATVAGTPGVKDTAWRRYVVAVDNTAKQVKIYRDGALLITGSAAAWAGALVSTATTLTLGKLSTPGVATGVSCKLADFVADIGHLWSAADVAADFEGSTPDTYTHRWPLDEGYGSTARATRGGLPLTLSGGAVFSADTPHPLRGVVRNFISNSGDGTKAGWSVLKVTPSVVATSTPISSTVTRLTEQADAGVSTHALYRQSTSLAEVADGKKRILWAVVKPGARGFVGLFALGGMAVLSTYFNLSTGAVGTVTGAVVDKGIVPLDGGYFLVWISFLATLSSAFTCGLQVTQADATPNYQGSLGTIAIDVAGMQLEREAPGQTTPSTYVETLDAPLSVFGLRDTRQNYLIRSEAINSLWTPDNSGAGTVPTVTANYTPAPNGDLTATRVQFIKTSAAGALSRIRVTRSAGNVGTAHAFAIWAKTNDGTTKVVSIRIDAAVTLITVTPSWQRFLAVEVIANATPVWQILLYTTDGTSDTADVSLWGAQIAQTDQMPEYVKTVDNPVNPSGAPRKAKPTRALGTSRKTA